MARAAVLLAAILALAAPAAEAATGADFYRLNERWEKARASGETKDEAVEKGFVSALAQNVPASPAAPVTPPIRRNLAQIVQTRVRLELNQTLFLTANGIVKFVSTEEGVVSLTTFDTNTLQITGTRFGTTFVHVWDGGGRQSFEIECVPPTYVPSEQQLRKIQELEKNRPLRLGYSNDRNAFYSGDKWRDRDRTSLDFYQTFTALGDTPYGTASGYASTQKSGEKQIITDAQAALTDGRVGPFKDFNAYAGDSSVTTGLMAFPEARIRGAQIQHWRDERRTRLKSFYGREKFGIIGTLTPGVIRKRSVSSYLGGGLLEHDFANGNRARVGYFNAHGTARPDELNRHAVGTKGDFAWGPNVTFSPETDFDNERVAHRHAVTARTGTMTTRAEFRDISKKFQTLVGTPSQQGEVGYRVDVDARPTEDINLNGTLDIFRDRLIPNPDNPDRYNVHRDLDATWRADDATTLGFFYKDIDDTGRLGPTKQRTLGGQANRLVRPWDHRVSLFSRYQNRGYRNLLDSSLNYIVDQTVFGVQTELFLGIGLLLEKEINFLSEPNLDRRSTPHATTVTLDYTRQIGQTPFSFNLRARYRDEEETESPNSFMAGEDLTEFAGGLYYRDEDDVELYMTGRVSSYRPESLNLDSPRVEAEFLTGMRIGLDTGLTWQAKGDFEGFVYKDMNGDGERAEDEPGLGGIAVRTSDGKDDVSDAQGFYELRGVAGKRAVLTLDVSKLPYGYVPTGPVQREFTIGANFKEQVDFGIAPRTEVSGVVFNDLNGNGKFDAGDKGVAKVALTLDGKPERTRTSGTYVFSGVIAGSHVIALDLATLPAGYLPAGPVKHSIEVFEGIRYEQSFAVKAQRALNGRVYFDDNGSGFFEADERAAAGVRVALGARAATTDADGYYLFDELAPGRYSARVDSGVPEGYEAGEGFEVEMGIEPLTLTDKNLPLRKRKA